MVPKLGAHGEYHFINPAHDPFADKVIALYPYKAVNDDELSFEKDDIISVLGRDEPEWWRGECQGLTGLFPSNYVGPFVTSGNSKWHLFGFPILH